MVIPELTLPANIDAEKIVLGILMMEDQHYPAVADILAAADLHFEPHQRIFGAMATLYASGEKLDYVTVANTLQSRGQLQACGGVTYLVSLTDGLPKIGNLDSYLNILKDKAIRRRGIFAAHNLMNRFMTGDETSGDILLACQKTINMLSDSLDAGDGWITPYEVIQKYPGGAHAFIVRKPGGDGIATPWPSLTTKLGGGLHEGDLFIIGGRPSMGKSIVGMQIAHHAALNGHGAAFFSLEMSRESLTGRLLCALASVDHDKWREGYLNVVEQDKMRCAGADFETLPFRIEETKARTVSAISAALRRLIVNLPVKVVVIDHLQLMRATGRRENKRNEELSDICNELKYQAQKLKVTVVLLSQLNRQCEIENRQPQLSDLKETGTLEEDADVVLFVHRAERYAKNRGREELRGLAEFIVAKQRDGSIGVGQMVFLGKYQRFESKAGETENGIHSLDSKTNA